MDAFNLIEHRLQLLSRAGDDLQQKIKIASFVSLFALPAAFGAEAVFFTGPISDFGGALVSVVVYLLTIRKILNKRSPAEPLPEV